MATLVNEKCVACRRDAPRVPEEEIPALRQEIPDWELIEQELSQDPFALGENPQGFLIERAARLDLRHESIPSARFITELIVPAYQQSLARLILEARLPLRCFGRGWKDLPWCSVSAGEITSREQFAQIIDGPIALVDLAPGADHRASESTNRPIVRGRNRDEFLMHARAAIAGKLSPPNIGRPLDATLIRDALAAIQVR